MLVQEGSFLPPLNELRILDTLTPTQAAAVRYVAQQARPVCGGGRQGRNEPLVVCTPPCEAKWWHSSKVR